MNKIVGIYRNEKQADRILKALEDWGIDKDALNTFSRPHVEVDDVDNESSAEIMVTAYVQEDQKDEVETIFKNSDALYVNVWAKDWEPETTWSPIFYARTTNT